LRDDPRAVCVTLLESPGAAFVILLEDPSATVSATFLDDPEAASASGTLLESLVAPSALLCLCSVSVELSTPGVSGRGASRWATPINRRINRHLRFIHT
jgi:hypothetical protein